MNTPDNKTEENIPTSAEPRVSDCGASSCYPLVIRFKVCKGDREQLLTWDDESDAYTIKQFGCDSHVGAYKVEKGWVPAYWSEHDWSIDDIHEYYDTPVKATIRAMEYFG